MKRIILFKSNEGHYCTKYSFIVYKLILKSNKIPNTSVLMDLKRIKGWTSGTTDLCKLNNDQIGHRIYRHFETLFQMNKLNLINNNTNIFEKQINLYNSICAIYTMYFTL